MSTSQHFPKDFSDEEYRYAYTEDFLNTKIATQICVLREQRGWTQEELAQRIGTKQSGISRLENVNYSAWKIETLKKIARAFGVRLRCEFEAFSSLHDEEMKFGRKELERPSFDEEIAEQEKDAEVPPAATSARTLAELGQRIKAPKHQMKEPGISLAQLGHFSGEPSLLNSFSEDTSSSVGIRPGTIFIGPGVAAQLNVNPLENQNLAQVPATRTLFKLFESSGRTSREPMKLISQLN